MADDPSPTWYAGLDDDHRTHITSKGWDKLDAPAAAVAMSTAYRGLEKLHGSIAAGNMVSLPKPEDGADVQKAFWQKLGAPPAADGYKFDDLKFKDGTGLDPAFADAVRAAASATNMPAPLLNAFLAQMLPHMETEEVNEAAAKQVAAAASKAALETEWGADLMKNKFIASRAMDALGLSPEALAAVESLPSVGYQGVMNMMLKLGTQMGEARFVPGQGQGGGTMTPDQARDQLAAYAKDSAWVTRFANGGVNEITQRNNLTAIIAGAK